MVAEPLPRGVAEAPHTARLCEMRSICSTCVEPLNVNRSMGDAARRLENCTFRWLDTWSVKSGYMVLMERYVWQ